MSNEKFSLFSLKLCSHARKYLCFVTAVYLIAGIICAGLYLNVFGFIGSVNSYILADELLGSMIRSMTAAAIMVLTIDLLSAMYGEHDD